MLTCFSCWSEPSHMTCIFVQFGLIADGPTVKIYKTAWLQLIWDKTKSKSSEARLTVRHFSQQLKIAVPHKSLLSCKLNKLKLISRLKLIKRYCIWKKTAGISLQIHSEQFLLGMLNLVWFNIWSSECIIWNLTRIRKALTHGQPPSPRYTIQHKLEGLWQEGHPV